MVWCSVVWCDVVLYGVMWDCMVWCGIVWCDVVLYGVMWNCMLLCGVVWCDVVLYGVMWYCMMWCGIVWCDVVLYGVMCYVMWYYMVWCGIVWCDVVLYGVMWYCMIHNLHSKPCYVALYDVMWYYMIWCGLVCCCVLLYNVKICMVNWWMVWCSVCYWVLSMMLYGVVTWCVVWVAAFYDVPCQNEQRHILMFSRECAPISTQYNAICYAIRQRWDNSFMKHHKAFIKYYGLFACDIHICGSVSAFWSQFNQIFEDEDNRGNGDKYTHWG